MKRTIGIGLVVLGVALGVWGLMQHEQVEPDIKIGELEIGVEKKKGLPVPLLIGAGVALVAGLVLVAGKRE